MTNPNGANATFAKRPHSRTHYQPPAISLAIYPVILLLGSLYSSISPTAQPAASVSSSALKDPGENVETGAINYFARKNNIFNVYFVKIGWIWTTVAFLSLLWAYPAFNSGRVDRNCRLRRVWQAFVRYALVTMSWILTTQWCFGPAIIDRGFVATGGECLLSHSADQSTSPTVVVTTLTAMSCKANGGSWRGGHDISGHVFMLAIASAFLAFELVGSLWPNDDQESKNKDEETRERETDMSGTQNEAMRLSRNFVLLVIGLSLWMLLMTGIWFHTWQEKTSGLLIALGTMYAVYILPRTLDSWGNIVGVPGV